MYELVVRTFGPKKGFVDKYQRKKSSAHIDKPKQKSKKKQPRTGTKENVQTWIIGNKIDCYE
jgi:hypothetical protein